MDNAPTARRRSSPRYLPWITGAAAFLFYLLTLNPWLSFINMAQVAKVSGFSWQSEIFQPLWYLASAPLRLLPTHWTPVGVNVLSAISAALVIALLTRAVMLLPRNRTHQQRERETSDDSTLSGPWAWLPPVFAALMLTLQLSFWQNATNGTPEMVNLVLLAYVIRALLEFRSDGQDSWLCKAALAYGALMTSDWLAVALFPAFVAALIWLKELSFFKGTFLMRCLTCGVIGLSLYFLLPTLAALNADSAGFWLTLKRNLGDQKTVIFAFANKDFLLLALTSLIPLLVLSFRWASYFGDTSQLGITMATTVFHIAHAAVLVICVWVMFDPTFSPRNSGRGMGFLNLYLISALCIGYYSGYFLLVFRPILSRARRTVSGNRFMHQFAVGIIVLMAVAMPLGLIAKNLPVVYESKKRLLGDFARLTTENLPKNAYLLADDARRALMTKLWLARTGRDADFVIVETWPLQYPQYRRHLKRQYGERWPFDATSNPTNQAVNTFALETIKTLAKTGNLYYLHPSFGVYFEYFHAEPHGMVYQLHPYAGNELIAPKLTPERIAENESFWKKAETEVLPKLVPANAALNENAKLGLRARLLEKFKIPDDLNGESRAAGGLISRALNFWAVEVQKTGDLEKSAHYFSLAHQINRDNVAAKANLEFNEKYRAGERSPVAMPPSVEDRFGERYRSWDQVLSANGPFDEPNLSYAQGFTYVRQGLLRQAAAAFERVHAFAPDDLPTRLWLAQLNLIAHQPARTLELVRDIIDNPTRFEATITNRVDALSLSARAYFSRQEPDQAVAALEGAVKSSPTNSYLLANITGIYTEQGRFSNALATIERQLHINPNDTSSLLNLGFAHIQMGNFPGAIDAMTRLLSLETNNVNALLNRAIAYLRNDQLDQARGDYETLLTEYPGARQVHFGLAEIAYRRQDTNTAVQHYEAYRSNAVPDTAETKLVEKRLLELRGIAPPP